MSDNSKPRVEREVLHAQKEIRRGTGPAIDQLSGSRRDEEERRAQLRRGRLSLWQREARAQLDEQAGKKPGRGE